MSKAKLVAVIFTSFWGETNNGAGDKAGLTEKQCERMEAAGVGYRRDNPPKAATTTPTATTTTPTTAPKGSSAGREGLAAAAGATTALRKKTLEALTYNQLGAIAADVAEGVGKKPVSRKTPGLISFLLNHWDAAKDRLP